MVTRTWGRILHFLRIWASRERRCPVLTMKDRPRAQLNNQSTGRLDERTAVWKAPRCIRQNSSCCSREENGRAIGETGGQWKIQDLEELRPSRLESRRVMRFRTQPAKVWKDQVKGHVENLSLLVSSRGRKKTRGLKRGVSHQEGTQAIVGHRTRRIL